MSSFLKFEIKVGKILTKVDHYLVIIQFDNESAFENVDKSNFSMV